MNNPDPSPAPAAAAGRPQRSPVAARLGVAAIVLLLTLAAVAIGIPWGRYRLQNVVLSDAVVKGTITRIGARIEGRIKSVEVEVGQQVTRGEVLLRLDDRHLQAALERARGELQSAQRDLESEKMGIEKTRRRLTLDAERANANRKKAAGELEATRSTLDKLEKQYQRMAVLTNSGAIALMEMDRVAGDRDRARGMLSADIAVIEAAEYNYQKAMNELDGLVVREARLGVLEAQITMARARVAAAEADLDAVIITAPEDGRVVERIVEVGGSAKVGEPMISLWIGRAWVEAWADERDLCKIHVGSPADISLDASPRRKLGGRVEAIGLVTDKYLQHAAPASLHAFVRPSAMVPVRLSLEEDNSKVQLGLSVLVGIRKEGDAAQDASSRAAVEPTRAPKPTAARTGGVPQPASLGSPSRALTKVNAGE